MMRKQCKACPWKVSTVPDQDIPDGYDGAKHARLRITIASEDGTLWSGRYMACHESPSDEPHECVGWLAHQLGPGNNLGLRLAARDGRYRDLALDGEQHATFEATLPKKA